MSRLPGFLHGTMSRKSTAITAGVMLVVGLIGGGAVIGSGNADKIDTLTAENSRLEDRLDSVQKSAAESDRDAAESRQRAEELDASTQELRQKLNDMDSALQEQKQKTADAAEEAEAALALVEERDNRIHELESVAASAPAPNPEPAPEPASDPVPAPVPAPAPAQNSGPFKNCTEARAAGAAPVHRGDPGYARHLDRDGDGIGCE